jgi:ribonuclease HI
MNVSKDLAIAILDNWIEIHSCPDNQFISVNFGEIDLLIKALETVKQRLGISQDYPMQGMAVDASCLGNPGPGEYQGVDLTTGVVLFHKKLPIATNNICEFLAVVEALKFENIPGPIYTDSVTALAWYRNKAVKTTLANKQVRLELFSAIRWLRENQPHRAAVLKWNTAEWGENPADFGRK